jgi:hypothetical protein
MSKAACASHASAPPLEKAVLGAIVLTFLVVNVWTATWHPAPWMDEVLSAEPAVNLSLGKGFTTTSSQYQPSTEMWAVNSPLHQILLAGWLWILGLSPTALRSLNMVWMAVAAVLMWWASLRLALLARPVSRLVLVGLLLTGAGTTYVARYGRPDGITVLLSAGTLLAWSISRPRARRLTLFGLALLYPIAGLQLVAYAGVLCLLLWIFAGRKFLRTGLLLAAGSATGLALLLTFYALNGVLLRFLTNTVAATHVISGNLAQMVVLRDAQAYNRMWMRLEALEDFWKCYLIDPSFLPLLAALVIACLGLRILRGRLGRSVPSFGLVAALTVPPLILFVGKYPFYYTWMGFLPLALTMCRAFEDLWAASRSVLLRCAFCVPLLYTGLVGLPWELAATTAPRRGEIDRIAAFIDDTVGPQDWVYGEAAIYYRVKQRASGFTFAHPINARMVEMPTEEGRRISVLILSPYELEMAVQRLGGEWAATGQELELANAAPQDPRTVNPLIVTAAQVDRLNLSLCVYRRQEAAPVLPRTER